jgi:hypothetical protein
MKPDRDERCFSAAHAQVRELRYLLKRNRRENRTTKLKNLFDGPRPKTRNSAQLSSNYL